MGFRLGLILSKNSMGWGKDAFGVSQPMPDNEELQWLK